MLKYIYLDNFRGFSDTFIPIRDVNFLVGENSTGKTSVLTLARLLCSPRFWFQPDLHIQDIGLGHFRDIVSVHSSDRSYFRIGMILPATESRNGLKFAFLMTFRQSQALPRLSALSVVLRKQHFHLRWAAARVFYKIAPPHSPLDVNELITHVFPTWVEQHGKHRTGYSQLKLPTRMPVLVHLSSVESISHNKAVPEIEDGYPIPPLLADELVWLAPIRTKSRRTYDEVSLEYSPEGTHTPYLIRKILNSKRDAKNFKRFIERIGSDSGLFQSVTIQSFGREATAPFELDIVLDEKELNLNNAGYGVSQSLPVIVEVFTRHEGSWFAIQQPEVHLHPRAQAAIGDVLFQQAVKEKKRFLVETHSDFTIDRFRLNYKKKSVNKPDAQVLFFERRQKGNHVTPLLIDKKGQLPGSQPKNYRDFFVRQEMRLLGL